MTVDVHGLPGAEGVKSRPRVLILLGTSAGWSRGIVKGFTKAAHEQDWMLLHYHPSADADWLLNEWAPDSVVIGPGLLPEPLAELPAGALVSVTVDRSAEGIASVCLDEAAIARVALDHLIRTGVRRFSTFRFDESPFAIARERAFVESARAAGAGVAPGWAGQREDPAFVVAWLRQLPKPCGVFTCTDSWGKVVARYLRVAGLRVPEDVALVGVDNDVLECELIAPPLSSVMIPWHDVGRLAAGLVGRALSGESIQGSRTVLSPIAVARRRSSDLLAAADPLVAKAVRWIRANAERRLTVNMVAHAVGGGRQRLERRFRASLDRTVHDEIRRAHVDLARGILETTDTNLVQVAQHSGFTNAALLSVAFQREFGMPPGLYRRRVQQELGLTADE